MGFDDAIASMDHDGDDGVVPNSAPIKLDEADLMSIDAFKNQDT